RLAARAGSPRPGRGRRRRLGRARRLACALRRRRAPARRGVVVQKLEGKIADLADLRDVERGLQDLDVVDGGLDHQPEIDVPGAETEATPQLRHLVLGDLGQPAYVHQIVVNDGGPGRGGRRAAHDRGAEQRGEDRAAAAPRDGTTDRLSGDL